MAGIPQRVPQVALADGIAVNLIAQIGGVADALHDAIGHAHRHPAHIHEFERRVRDIVAGHPRQQLARLGSGNLEPRARVRDVLNPHAVLQMAVEPPRMPALRAIAGGQLELLL